MHAGKIRNCVFLMKMSKYGEGLIDIHFSHLTELLKVTKTIVLSPPRASPGFGRERTNSAQFYAADLFSNILLRLSVHCAIKFKEGFN